MSTGRSPWRFLILPSVFPSLPTHIVSAPPSSSVPTGGQFNSARAALISTRTNVQPHAWGVLPALADCDMQWRVAVQAVSDVGVARLVLEDVLEDLSGAVEDAGVSDSVGGIRTRSGEL